MCVVVETFNFFGHFLFLLFDTNRWAVWDLRSIFKDLRRCKFFWLTNNHQESFLVTCKWVFSLPACHQTCWTLVETLKHQISWVSLIFLFHNSADFLVIPLRTLCLYLLLPIISQYKVLAVIYSQQQKTMMLLFSNYIRIWSQKWGKQAKKVSNQDFIQTLKLTQRFPFTFSYTTSKSEAWRLIFTF